MQILRPSLALPINVDRSTPNSLRRQQTSGYMNLYKYEVILRRWRCCPARVLYFSIPSYRINRETLADLPWRPNVSGVSFRGRWAVLQTTAAALVPLHPESVEHWTGNDHAGMAGR
jgi:hypothetical protein